ncbi:hypothetical protein [Desulfosporosinus hippei]|uniref:hypothetical protein n=1 Tax=Desulfosporosinus hippei TaxID=569859 RepID=UPI0015A3C1EC|nr:hypothetical protein [Desulfosporosinus hippei]
MNAFETIPQATASSERFRRTVSNYQRRMKQRPEWNIQEKPTSNVLTLIISR